MKKVKNLNKTEFGAVDAKAGADGLDVGDHGAADAKAGTDDLDVGDHGAADAKAGADGLGGSCVDGLCDLVCGRDFLRSLRGRFGFLFQKSYGQNFICDPSVPERMAGLLPDACEVLEIGTGAGALTAALCRGGRRVLSCEADIRLRELHTDILSGLPGLELRYADALSQLEEAAKELREPYLCANLPYNITSQTVAAAVRPGLFAGVLLMLQKEAALRICAGPSRLWGPLGIAAACYGSAEVVFEVPREAFFPAPAVDSAVIRITPHPEPVIDPAKLDRFLKFVSAAFSLRRKTLANSLSAAGYPADTVRGALSSLSLPCGARAEELSLDSFTGLFYLLIK